LCQRERERTYDSTHREQRRVKAAKYREQHPGYREEYLKQNPDYTRDYTANRYQKDVQFRLSRVLRSRLKHALNGNFKSGSAIGDLGCSIEYLKFWLECQFKPGMAWENYGEWQIDHIRPLSRFDLIDRKQLLIACNWCNLQPLWKADNIRKGDRPWAY
jgi:hypothetical protein